MCIKYNKLALHASYNCLDLLHVCMYVCSCVFHVASAKCHACSLSLSLSLSLSQSSPEPEDAVLKTVMARFGYTPQYDDELGFSAGDLIEVTVDSKSTLSAWFTHFMKTLIFHAMSQQ